MRKLWILLLIPFLVGAAPTRDNTYVTGSTILADDVMANEDAIFDYLQTGVDTIKDGSVVNADISATAAIAGSKISPDFGTGNMATTGTFIVRDPYIDVRSYGATGDGSTDDTSAINSALSAAGTANKAVYFPEGTYKITGELTLPADVDMYGDGIGSTVIDGSTAASLTNGLIATTGAGKTALPALASAIETGATTVTFSSAPSLSAGDIFLVVDENGTAGSWHSNKTTYDSGEYYIVKEINGSVVVIQSESVDGYPSFANAYSVGTTTNTIRDMEIRGNTSNTQNLYMISTKFGRNLNIERIRIKDSLGNGIWLKNCYGCSVRNSEIGKYNADSGSVQSTGIIVGSSQSCVVEGNTITMPRHAVSIGGGGDVVDRFHMVRDNTLQVRENLAAADFHGAAQYCTYENNHISGHVNYSGSENRFINNYIYNSTAASTINFEVLRSVGAIFDGNTIIYNGTSLVLDGSAATDITSATVDDGVFIFRNNIIRKETDDSETLFSIKNNGSLAENRFHFIDNVVIATGLGVFTNMFSMSVDTGDAFDQLLLDGNFLRRAGFGTVAGVVDISVINNTVSMPDDSSKMGDFASNGGNIVFKSNFFDGGKDQIQLSKTTNSVKHVDFSNNFITGTSPSEAKPVYITGVQTALVVGNTIGDPNDPDQTNPINYFAITDLYESGNVWLGTGDPAYSRVATQRLNSGTLLTVTTAGSGILMKSADGSCSLCTVSNADAFSCSPAGCSK